MDNGVMLLSTLPTVLSMETTTENSIHVKNDLNHNSHIMVDDPLWSLYFISKNLF